MDDEAEARMMAGEAEKLAPQMSLIEAATFLRCDYRTIKGHFDMDKPPAVEVWRSAGGPGYMPYPHFLIWRWYFNQGQRDGIWDRFTSHVDGLKRWNPRAAKPAAC